MVSQLEKVGQEAEQKQEQEQEHKQEEGGVTP
jgi:hypothetical protein